MSKRWGRFFLVVILFGFFSFEGIAFLPPPDVERSFLFDIRVQPSWKQELTTDLQAPFLQSRKHYAQNLKAQHTKLEIDFDRQLGAVKFLRNFREPTRAASFASRLDRLKAFVEEHRPLFGIGPEDWEQFQSVREASSQDTQLDYFIFQQRWGEYPIINAQLRAAVHASGEIVSMSSLCLNLSQVVAERFPDEVVYPLVSFRKVHLLQKAYFPKTAIQIIPALEIYYEVHGDIRTYRGIFSALDGELLYRESMTHFSLPPSAASADFLVFAESLTEPGIPDHEFRFRPMDSPQPSTPGPSLPDYSGLNDPPYANQSFIFPWINSIASPLGWLGALSSNGNNVRVYRDWDINGPDFGFNGLLAGESGAYHYPINFDEPMTTPENTKAALLQAAFTANWFHDRLHEAGFTEEFANFQVENFDRGGVGGDPIEVITQFGFSQGHFNLAVFTGLPMDGWFGHVKLGLFNSSDSLRDAALDSIVVMHELTHSVVRRLLPMNGWQGDGLNEGWADFIALSLVGFEEDPIDGNYPVGSYISKNTISPESDSFYFGARRFPYSTNLHVNPLTFEDIDPLRYHVDSSIPINPLSYGNPLLAHNIGEVWASLMWEVRAQILQGRSFAETQRVILRLFVESLKLAPIFPHFLQMREALFLADEVLFSGEYRCALWRGFAKRGFGLYAALGFSEYSVRVDQESYEFPQECSQTTARLGDFNGDGQVDGADLAFLLAQWGAENSVADLNLDGQVDGADLAMLLSVWGL
jgi:hypothetical protein